MTVKYFYSNGASGIKVTQPRAPVMVCFGTTMISGAAVSKKKKNTQSASGENKESGGENLLVDSH